MVLNRSLISDYNRYDNVNFSIANIYLYRSRTVNSVTHPRPMTPSYTNDPFPLHCDPLDNDSTNLTFEKHRRSGDKKSLVSHISLKSFRTIFTASLLDKNCTSYELKKRTEISLKFEQCISVPLLDRVRRNLLFALITRKDGSIVEQKTGLSSDYKQSTLARTSALLMVDLIATQIISFPFVFLRARLYYWGIQGFLEYYKTKNIFSILLDYFSLSHYRYWPFPLAYNLTRSFLSSQIEYLISPDRWKKRYVDSDEMSDSAYIFEVDDLLRFPFRWAEDLYFSQPSLNCSYLYYVSKVFSSILFRPLSSLFLLMNHWILSKIYDYFLSKLETAIGKCFNVEKSSIPYTYVLIVSRTMLSGVFKLISYPTSCLFLSFFKIHPLVDGHADPSDFLALPTLAVFLSLWIVQVSIDISVLLIEYEIISMVNEEFTNVQKKTIDSISDIRYHSRNSLVFEE